MPKKNPYAGLVEQISPKKLEDEFIEELAVVLNQISSDHFHASKKKKAKADSRWFTPSRLYMEDRYWFYYLTGCEPDTNTMSADGQRIVDNGRYMHERYEKEYFPALVEKGVIKPVSTEETAECAELRLRGRSDSRIEFRGVEMIAELKSCHDEKFRLLSKPMQEHIIQGISYYLLHGVRNILFVYENKNTQKIKAFRYVVTEAAANKLKAKIKRILTSVEEKQIPDFCSKYCIRCEFLERCRTDAIQEGHKHPYPAKAGAKK